MPEHLHSPEEAYARNSFLFTAKVLNFSQFLFVSTLYFDKNFEDFDFTAPCEGPLSLTQDHLDLIISLQTLISD